MYWKFNDVQTENMLGTIDLPCTRLGVILIVDIERTKYGVMLCINGKSVYVPFGTIVEEQGYKIRCYKNLTRITLFIS